MAGLGCLQDEPVPPNPHRVPTHTQHATAAQVPPGMPSTGSRAALRLQGESAEGPIRQWFGFTARLPGELPPKPELLLSPPPPFGGSLHDADILYWR